MQEIATVIENKGKVATVEITRKDECSKCGLCGMKKDQMSIRIPATNDIGAKVGDRVLVETQEKGKMLAIFLAFLVPLILIGFGWLIGYLISSEIWMLLSSLILLVLWYTILAIIDKKMSKMTKFCSVILKIEGEKDE